MKKAIATLAIAGLGVLGGVGPAAASSASSSPIATTSCVNAHTPGGTKCLQNGEYCSHKAGYAAAYRRAGFKCKANGRLTEI
jgi:hypothetical protein